MKVSVIIFTLFFCGVSAGWAQQTDDGFYESKTPVPPQAKYQILYFANINGNLENCGCGEPPLGGMDNLAYWVDTFRHKNFKTLVIAGGDILNTYPDTLLNTAVFGALKLIHPDVYAPGEQEILTGASFFQMLLKKSPFYPLTTNYILNTPRKRFKTHVTINSPPIYILSRFSDILFKKDDRNRGYDRRNALFEKYYQKLPEKAYAVLLYHGALQEFFKFIKKYPRFNLALLAHDQRLQVIKDGKTRIVLPGADGEYLIRIVLSGPSRHLKSWIQKIPVSVSPKANPVIGKLIRSYHKKAQNTNFH